MLALPHARKPAPPLAARAMWLRHRIGPDAFGSALGDSIVGSIQRADASKVPPPVSAEEKAQILAGFAGGPGGEGATSYPVRTPGQMDIRTLPSSDGGDSPERQAQLARIMRLANDPASLGSGGAPFRVAMGGTRADVTNAGFEFANQIAVDIASRNGEDLAPTIANAARLRLEAVNGGLSGVELAQRFGQGVVGAVKAVTVEPVLQVRDMGTALASVTYNELLRSDGDAMWFPEMKSGTAQAYANGASQGRLLLQSNPITALPVMGYDLGMAVRNSDWGTVAEMGGGLVAGVAVGAGVKKYGGYGIAFDDVSGPMQSQMGAINPRFVKPIKVDGMPDLATNPKHVPGGDGYNRNAGTQPADYAAAYEKAITGNAGKSWFAASTDGAAIYRYSNGRDGTVHWSGSTADTSTPMTRAQVPPEIAKQLGFKLKGGKWK